MFEASLELKGDEVLLAASKDFRRKLPRVGLNAIRRVIRRTITVAKKEMRAQSGIGQSIWGKKASGLNALVTMIRARGTTDTVETGIRLKGLPRLLEVGGKTLAHKIEPKNAPRLAFEVGGKLVFAKKVNHPGSRVRPHNIAGALLRGAEAPIRREVAESIVKLKEQVFGQRA